MSRRDVGRHCHPRRDPTYDQPARVMDEFDDWMAELAAE
jgi:hypothetical protein